MMFIELASGDSIHRFNFVGLLYKEKISIDRPARRVSTEGK
jgi:hypothetical protein